MVDKNIKLNVLFFFSIRIRNQAGGKLNSYTMQLILREHHPEVQFPLSVTYTGQFVVQFDHMVV